MFHQILDVKLIRQVRNHPVLYDYNHDKYMDFNAREVAWQRIGDELKRSGAECKVRWINIRDVHRRILKNNLTKTSARRKVYKYEHELGFMRHFYKDVPVVDCDVEDINMARDWNTVISPDDDTAQDSCSEDSEKPIKRIKEKRRKGKKRKEPCYEEEEKQASSSLNDTQATSGDVDVSDHSDPVDAFLSSIGATLKTFSPYHLNIAKSKIFAVVQEHDLQQIVQRENQGQSDVKPPRSEEGTEFF